MTELPKPRYDTKPDTNPSLYLILHKVRGEATFDIGQRLDIGSAGGWIIPTSGHRAYPYRWWNLDDLADISDIDRNGGHTRPASTDHTLPPNWPDHYEVKPLEERRVRATRSPSPLHNVIDDLTFLGWSPDEAITKFKESQS